MSKNSHYIPKHQEIHLFRLYKLCLYLQKKDASFDTSFPKKMNYSGKIGLLIQKNLNTLKVKKLF